MSQFLINRWLHILFLLSLLFVLVFVISPYNPIRQRIQLIIFDTYLSEYPRESSNSVYIIDIDDESLKQQGQWPWPRTVLAKLIENLNDLGAEVIAFDGVLAEPDRTSPTNFLEGLPQETYDVLTSQYDVFLIDNDDILTKAIKESGNFISGFTHGIDEKRPRLVQNMKSKKDVRAHFLQESFQMRKTAKFITKLEDAAAGNGSFMAKPELDNVIRKTPMLFSNQTYIYPSLSLETIRLHENAIPIIKQNEDFSQFSLEPLFNISIGKKTIPIDVEGEVWIYFQKDYQDRYIPAYQVLDQTYNTTLKQKIQDKIIYIASSAEGLKDLRATPIGLLPGVEVHANVTEQIIDQNFLTRPLMAKEIENYFILGFGLLFIGLTFFLNLNWLVLFTTVVTSGAFYTSFIAFTKQGILIDPIYPSLSILIIFVLAALLKYVRSEVERKQVREAFGLYVSPDFMKELTDDPTKLKLGGEIRELTVMFTDIRSFTTISESLSPEELIQLMNDFLTPMSNLVMDNRGTIDKYMGDAMMAFWNAPLDDKDHARHACLTALKMNEALMPINEAVKAQCKREHRPFTPLLAGIGINTGECSVGNMGSKQRFAYSALGDAVNLASRLEGQTKNYGVNILIGEDTAESVSDLALLELDMIQVKGRNKPIRIYTILGDETRAQNAYFQSWKREHDDMLAAYRSGHFIEAENILLHAKERAHLDMIDYYVMMMMRIESFQKQTPEKWTGVYVAETK